MKVTLSRSSYVQPAFKPAVSSNASTELPRFGMTDTGRRRALLGLAALTVGGFAALFEAQTGVVRDQLWAPSPETAISKTVKVTEADRAYVKATRHYPVDQKRANARMAAFFEFELLPMNPKQSASAVFTQRPNLTRAEKEIISRFAEYHFFKWVDQGAASAMANANIPSDQKYKTLLSMTENRVTSRWQRDPKILANQTDTMWLRNQEFTVRVVAAGASNGPHITDFTH